MAITPAEPTNNYTGYAASPLQVIKQTDLQLAGALSGSCGTSCDMPLTTAHLTSAQHTDKNVARSLYLQGCSTVGCKSYQVWTECMAPALTPADSTEGHATDAMTVSTLEVSPTDLLSQDTLWIMQHMPVTTVHVGPIHLAC